MEKNFMDPHVRQTERVQNDTYGQTNVSRLNNNLDEWIDKASSQRPQSNRLTVTEQMVCDFETATGLHGIGKKMVAAGFWRISTQKHTHEVQA